MNKDVKPRRIAIFTGSRADADPLRYVIDRLGVHIHIEGMYGLEGEIRAKIKLAKPDIFLCLGDRFETLIAAAVAAEMAIPIAHVSGGEESLGATDNAFRNAITKLSYWHFIAHQDAARRVIQMGEHPDRVFIVGDPQIDAIAFEPAMSKEECEKELGIELKSPVLLITLHPETLSEIAPAEQARRLIEALSAFHGTQIISGSNSDRGGGEISSFLENYARTRPNAVYRPSFGMTLYTNLIRHCDAVVGNSSSGVIEAPAMGIPSVNIGDRQKGRILGRRTIPSDFAIDNIISAIQLACVVTHAPDASFGIPGQVSPAIVDKLLSVEIPKTPIKAWHHA